MTLSTKL